MIPQELRDVIKRVIITSYIDYDMYNLILFSHLDHNNRFNEISASFLEYNLTGLYAQASNGSQIRDFFRFQYFLKVGEIKEKFRDIRAYELEKSISELINEINIHRGYW